MMERYNLNTSRIAVGGASAALVYTPETSVPRLPVTIENHGEVTVKLYCSSSGTAPVDPDNYVGLLPQRAVEVNPDIIVYGISSTLDVCNVVVQRGLRHVGLVSNVLHDETITAIEAVETAVEAVEAAIEGAESVSSSEAALELTESRSLVNLVAEMVLLQRIMLTHFAGWSGEELKSTDAAEI